MVAARLTAALLAPKGAAAPATGAYSGTGLEPLVAAGRGGLTLQAFPVRAELPRPAVALPAAAPPARPRLSLSVDAEHHRRLRILAARRGRPAHELLREALDSVLRADAADCPCVQAAAECCGGRNARSG
ncbi:MAG: hypothetical protein U1E14_16995 [Geminicoccaceae bacterium]